MSMQTHIEQQLQQGLAPSWLDVVNESHMHRTAPGAESHFKVVVVSERFAGLRLLARHRLVNQLLAEALAGGVHALALHTYTPGEWAERGQAPRSPACAGKPGLDGASS